jgi:hypothetical protein
MSDGNVQHFSTIEDANARGFIGGTGQSLGEVIGFLPQ